MATFCDYLLSQSREDIERAIETHICSSRKIAYLGNGIDVTRFSPGNSPDHSILLQDLSLTEEEFIVGSVERLVYEKGFAELFAAAEILTTEYYRFIIVGPQERDQNDAVSPQQIEALEQRQVVLFPGWQDDMPKWYSLIHVFVLASHREGVPCACMEAVAMGCPIIATDIRGCREVVRHGETGLLVPVKDVATLVQTIKQLRSDKSRRTEMGIRGRRHIVENFSHELVLNRLRQFYLMIESVLDRASDVDA